MQNARKNLKDFSALILFLLGLTVIRLVVEFIFNYDKVKAGVSGVTDGEFGVAYVITFVIFMLMCLPDFYIGIKGLKMAKNPNKSGAHIVWAKILFVLCVIAVISPIVSFVKYGYSFDNLLELLNFFAEACVYFYYIKCAIQVRKEA